MDAIIQAVASFIQVMKLSDLVDIALVAILLYNLLKMIRETRALQLVKGLIILFLALQLSAWLNLTTMNYLLRNTMQVGMFAIIVIFQPELRSMLERVGRSKVGSLIDFSIAPQGEEQTGKIDEIVEACVHLSYSKTGALIVLERETKLGDVINTGTYLEADITSALLENIFVPNTPLHDGAVVIRGDKILTAGCLLPLTSNSNLSRELGTRHRAALGMSETSDAMVVVVSEETGKISLAVSGSLTRNLNEASLKHALMRGLENPKPRDIQRIKFWKGASK